MTTSPESVGSHKNHLQSGSQLRGNQGIHKPTSNAESPESSSKDIPITPGTSMERLHQEHSRQPTAGSATARNPHLKDVFSATVATDSNPRITPAEQTEKEAPQPADTSIHAQQLSPREQLIRSCLNNESIGNDLSLVPGAYAEYDIPDDAKDISEGEFGIVIRSKKTGEPIARAGFDVDRVGQTIIIGHPPQGARKTEVSRDAWGEIVGQGDTFRAQLVNGIVNVAERLGLPEVIGISAENHLGVQYRHIPAEKGPRIMDDVYRTAGFTQDPNDLNFHFQIPQQEDHPTSPAAVTEPVSNGKREDPSLPSPEQLRNPWESETAWTQVYKTLEPQLKRQALQLTKGNVHDAEDLVQTALQKLYSQINKGTEITNIAGYARSTLHHAGIDHIRDKLRTPPPSSLDMPVVAPSGEEEPLIGQLPSIQNVEAEALEPLIAKDLIALLRTTKMSDDQLGTLLLHAAGLSPKEIAELRNTPDATIRGRLARARATAAEALTPYVPPDEITRRRLKWVTPEQS